MNFLTGLHAAEETAAQISFQPLNFLENLKYMGIGMLVIFAVIGVIVLTTVLINKVFAD